MTRCPVCGSEHFDDLFLESIAKKESVISRLGGLASLLALQQEQANGLKELHAQCASAQRRLEFESIRVQTSNERLQKQQEVMQRNADNYRLFNTELLCKVEQLACYFTFLQTKSQMAKNLLIIKKKIKQLLIDDLHFRQQQLKHLRYKAAITLFQMIPILTLRSGNGTGDLSGISTILGYPLQNIGNNLGIPPDLIIAALSITCHLVDCLSTVLNIPLVHPMKMFLSRDVGVIISLGSNQQVQVAIKKEFMSNRSFSLAVLLMNANIINLCVKCGLALGSLYSPQASLLNLHLLHAFCEEKAKLPAPAPPLPAEVGAGRMYESLRHRYAVDPAKSIALEESIRGANSWEYVNFDV